MVVVRRPRRRQIVHSSGLEFTVKPGQQATFEAAWKELLARREQVGSPVAVNVSVNDAGVYRVIRAMGTWENFEAYQQETSALPGEFPAEAFEHYSVL